MTHIKAYLVEDSAVIAENLIATLEELTSVRVVGHSGLEGEARAWLTAVASDWQLAIVDIFLREGSGLGVLTACKTRGAGRSLVVISNYATPEMRRHCLALGADAVFDKSTEIDALVDYCRALAHDDAV
ncbi:MAG: response regulator [Spongiibacteraceae bacterium]